MTDERPSELPDADDAPVVEPDPDEPESHTDEDQSDELPDEDDVPDEPT